MWFFSQDQRTRVLWTSTWMSHLDFFWRWVFKDWDTMRFISIKSSPCIWGEDFCWVHFCPIIIQSGKSKVIFASHWSQWHFFESIEYPWHETWFRNLASSTSDLAKKTHASNEQIPLVVVGYIGDEILPSYVGIISKIINFGSRS